MKKPSEIEDYFERLEISRDASKDDIKKAYRKLSHIYHPDHNSENEEMSKLEFIAIGEAYQNLIGEQKNKDYDKFSTKEKFDYFENLFGISSKEMIDLADEMSKNENEIIKSIGKIWKDSIFRLLG